MPGINQLAAMLEVSPKTIISAVRKLEHEGLLQSQGPGRRSRIVQPENGAPPALRVAILLYEKDDASVSYIIELLHRLQEAGHVVGFAQKTLIELGMDWQKVSRFVQKTKADAWLIRSGSREVLEWFARQPKPAFALAGRRTGIPIAGGGPDKLPALKTAMQRLFALGHRHIVMLAREERRKPHPGLAERMFLGEMEARGIPTGPFNLPEWEENPESFHKCIDSLFRHTPPTALLLQEMPLFIAAQQHLAQLGILAPRDVSLLCFDPDPAFAWCQPSVAHIGWDPRPLVRRAVGWTTNVAHGKDDRRQTLTKAEFIEGGTIGPAKNL